MLNMLNTVAESAPSVNSAITALQDSEASGIGVLIASSVFGVVLAVALIIIAKIQNRAAFGAVGVLLGAGFVLLGTSVSSVGQNHAEQELQDTIVENVTLYYDVEDVTVEEYTVNNEGHLDASVAMTEIEGETFTMDMTYDATLDMIVPVAIDDLNNMPVDVDTNETTLQDVE